MKNLLNGGANEDPVSPHLFLVAEQAYQDLLVDSRSQSIIISGESGSGKTEATKVIMSYLAKCNVDFSTIDQDTDLFNQVGQGSSGDHPHTLEQKVLDSNPVLEAFGNAKTVKNNNSSRFGKFIQVNFDRSGKI